MIFAFGAGVVGSPPAWGGNPERLVLAQAPAAEELGTDREPPGTADETAADPDLGAEPVTPPDDPFASGEADQEGDFTEGDFVEEDFVEADEFADEEGDEPSSDVEEITITGRKSEGVDDYRLSDSVTGFSGGDISELGIQTIADLSNFTPNLEIVTSGATTPTFFIRGVGLNDFNANSTSAVAIYQDDVPINSPALQLGKLFDVEKVNVLRGPQGTGLARNATAGAIKIYSRKPTGVYGGFLRAQYGNFDFVDLEGAVEAPIVSDILSLRIAGRWSRRDGYVTNGCGGLPSYQERKDQGLFRPNDNTGNGPGYDPRWSACGEWVKKTYSPLDRIANPNLVDGVGRVPAGLDETLNGQNSWAGRATLRFQPIVEMDWLLNVHGSRLDEQSTVGQSLGTSETLLFQDGSIREGVLGAIDGGRYSPLEVREARARRIAEYEARCAAAGNCTGDEANFARLDVARDLARNLDSKPWHVDVNRTGMTTNDTWGGYLKGKITLPHEMELTTTTGYDAYQRSIDLDLDFSPNELFEVVTRDEGWQFTQGLSLSGQFTDDLLTWEIGASYLQEELNVDVENFFGERQLFGVANRRYVQELKSALGYANLAWTFFEDFTLDGGFRYNWERKDIDYELVRVTASFFDVQTRTWNAPSGMARLTYRLRDDTHLFWKYNRGWKGGHFNATSSLIEGVTSADPEQIDAFEGGVHGSWFDSRVGLDASFFYYSYDEYQIFTIKNDVTTSTPEFVILNANEAESYGAEMDLVMKLIEGSFVNVRFAWLQTQFLDFVQEQFVQRTIGFDQITFVKEIQNTGNPLLNSPQFTVTITAEQAVTLGRWGTLTARYDTSWRDDTYYDATAGMGIPNTQGEIFLPENTIGQRAHWIHHLRLGYRTPSERIEIAGWVRNIGNTAVRDFGFDASAFQRTVIAFVNEPRTYGLELTVDF